MYADFGHSGCTGGTGTWHGLPLSTWPITLESTIIRAADEGIPISALNRIYKAVGIGLDIRAHLRAAVLSGRLVAMPAEDWPPRLARDQRVPMVAEHTLNEDDADLIIKMARTLKTTKQESHVLMVILRRGQATRELLHDAVEQNRGNPAEPTDIKIVDVVVCKLRKKLSLHGLLLNTVHSIGYEMSEEHRGKAWQIIREQTYVT